jgi:transcriptional regulator with XRE-family HTH domain
MIESMHEYVIAQLQATKGRWPLVAEQSGISRRTIEKIARREVADPGVSFIERLARYFHERELIRPRSGDSS